jgi:hypothetical protein
MVHKIKYTVEKVGDNFMLYSIVETDFGGSAKNYVTCSNNEHVLKAIAYAYGWEQI